MIAICSPLPTREEALVLAPDVVETADDSEVLLSSLHQHISLPPQCQDLRSAPESVLIPRARVHQSEEESKASGGGKGGAQKCVPSTDTHRAQRAVPRPTSTSKDAECTARRRRGGRRVRGR